VRFESLFSNGTITLCVGLAALATSNPPKVHSSSIGEENRWHTDHVRAPDMTFNHPEDWYFNQHLDGAQRWRHYQDGYGYQRSGV
jgi:hypothetical protein